LAEGIYVIAFSFPVVPQGKARIRTQMSAAHSDSDIDQAIEASSASARRWGWCRKALVKARREPGLWLEDVDKPKPGDRDVLIRVRKTSICGNRSAHPPLGCMGAGHDPRAMVVGHEFMGEIAAVGSAVSAGSRAAGGR